MNGKLNGSTSKWFAIVIMAILAVLGWSRNYGLGDDVKDNCVAIKENVSDISDLRTHTARDRAILERIETDVRDIKLMLQDE